MTCEHDDAIRHVARFLVDARDGAERNARQLNARAKVNGHDFDRRADAAEGAQGAYSLALSALAGATGRSVDDLTAELAPAFRPVEHAQLPSEITEPERAHSVPTSYGSSVLVLDDAEGDALTRQALIAEDDAER